MSKTLNERLWDERSNSLRKARAKHSKRQPSQHQYGDPSRGLHKARHISRSRDGVGNYNVKYDVIPPVKPKLNAFERTEDDEGEDSWGEASEGSDAEGYHPHSKASKKSKSKHPIFPLPPMSFALLPVTYPGSLGYRTTPPKRAKRKYQPKRTFQRRNIAKHDIGINAETQTEDLDTSDSTDTSIASPLTAVTPPPPHTPYPEYVQDPRYEYIRVERPVSLPAYDVSDEQRLLDDAALTFYDDKIFAEKYTSDLIDSVLQHEIIPDLLADALNEQFIQAPNQKYNQRLLPEVLQTSYNLPKPVGVSVHYLVAEAESSKQVADNILKEVLKEELYTIVRQTCSDYVMNYVRGDKHQQVLNDMVDEITRETVNSVISQILNEGFEESLLDDQIIKPALSDMIEDVAVETIKKYDIKYREKETVEMVKLAGTKLLDSLMLDYLLSQMMSQEEARMESHFSQYCIDEMILDVLLHRIVEVDNSKWGSIDIKPTKKFHDRVVDDVALDVLLNELCLHLDEDMKDYDEFESSLTDYLITRGDYDTDTPG